MIWTSSTLLIQQKLKEIKWKYTCLSLQILRELNITTLWTLMPPKWNKEKHDAQKKYWGVYAAFKMEQARLQD